MRQRFFQIIFLLAALALVNALLALPALAAEVTLREAQFDFEAIEGASFYEIRLVDKSGKEVFQPPLRLSEASWKGSLPPGAYTLYLRTLDQRQVPGPWSEGMAFAVRFPPVTILQPGPRLLASAKARPPTLFAWQALAGSLFHFELSDEKGKLLAQKFLKETELTLPLPYGKRYRWRVTALYAADESEPEKGSWRDLELLAAPLHPLKVKIIDEPTRKGFSWTAPPAAQTFSWTLERRDQSAQPWTVVQQIEKTGERLLILPPDSAPGTYRLKLIAEAPLHQDSLPREASLIIKAPPVPEKKAAAAIKRSDPGSLLIAYSPTIWRYTRSIPRKLPTTLNAVMLNSVQGEARYSWGEAQSWGAEGNYRRTATILFNGKQTGDAAVSGQEPLDIEQHFFRISAFYRWGTSHSGLLMRLGLSRGTLIHLVPDPQQRLGLQHYVTSAISYGVEARLPLGSKLIFAPTFDRESPSRASGLALTSGSRHALSLRLLYPILRDDLLLTVLLSIDQQSFELEPQPDRVSIESSQLMAGLGLSLVF